MRGASPIALVPLAWLACFVSGCASSSTRRSADGVDAGHTADAADAADANALCAESLASWCGRGGHLCVADLAAAIAPDSPYCTAIWGSAWTDGGCGAFDYVLVADTVDQVTKYVYDASTRRLVAVMDQTTIIETCLAGAPDVIPPRSCADPRNDAKTCCTPTGGGALPCALGDAGNDG
jgi:hypothetical protein